MCIRDRSPYIQELTHITQDQIDRDGMELWPAIERLRRFVTVGAMTAGTCVPMVSWGDDFAVLEANAALHHRILPSHTRALRACTRDVRPVLWAIGISTSGWHSGTIYRHSFVGAVPVSGHTHDASFDIGSVLATLQELARRGGKLSLIHI